MIPYEECELYKTVNDLGMGIDAPTDTMILAVGTRFMSQRAIIEQEDLMKLDAVKDIPLEALLFNKELQERRLLHD